MESRWVTPYAAETRARSSASLISSRRCDSGTATRVAGGIRSRAAKIVRTSASGAQPAGAALADRDHHEQVRGQGAGGVRDLGELRPVQRPVGDDPEHPARGQQRADLLRAAAQPLERAVPAVAEPPDLAAHAGDALADRPDVGHVQGRHRGALAVGQHQRPAGRVARIEALRQRGRHLERHRDLPRRAVGQPAAPADRRPGRRGS